MSLRRVAVTGLGAISGLGANVDAMWEGIRTARNAVGPIRNIPTDRLTVLFASEIADFKIGDHFAARDVALYDRVSQITLVAGREALAQAGLTAADLDDLGYRVGVTHAASPGQVTLDEAYWVFYGQSKPRVHPFTVPRIMGAGPAAALSIEFKAHGPCFGTASACSSSNHAIGLAFDMIRYDRLDVCLTGGSDASLIPGYIKGWEALRVLTTDACRPFSADRSGLVLGEAATVLVLEEWEHARARGAPILAELLGWGTTADAANMTAPDSRSAAASMQQALQDAGVSPGDIGYVSAHGTATRLNDKAESAALKEVFGGAVPPVSSLKSQVGHTLNASGGMETIATILALREQLLPATINFTTPDPECDVDCIPNTPRPARFDYALKNSLGFGGLNTALVLRRVA